MKEHIVQKKKSRKIVEKAVMMNKSVQLKLDFDFAVTAWVPAAKVNKPMPQVNITMNVAHDDLRIGCNRTQDIIDGLVEIIGFLEKNKQILDETALKEQEKWAELCNQQVNSVLKVVQLNKKQA